MGKTATLLLVLVLFVTCVFTFLPVKGEYEAIVVPDDYATLSLAIQNAGEGDTVFVKKGTYQEETITINKSISLIGEGINETILSFNPPIVEAHIFYNLVWVPDTAIKIEANNVKLQGFTIDLPKENYGVLSGIHAVGDRMSFIDNNVANRSNVCLSGSMLNVTGNLLSGDLEVAGSNVTIANNTIKGSLKVQGTFNLISANEIGSGYYWDGIRLDGSFNCVVGNVFSSMSTEHSNFNVIVGNSFVNLDLRKYGEGGCNNTLISKNQVTGNGGINDGIWLYYGENNTISGNNIRNCEKGLILGTSMSPAVSNSIYLNNFINNTDHVVSLSGSNHTVNRFDNGTKGNYYDDYHGNDANWDGVGDTAYTVQETSWDEELQHDVTIVFFQDNYPLMSTFDIEGFNIELPEWAHTTLRYLPEPETPDAFPTTLVIASVITIAAVTLGLLAYFKKRKH